MTDALLKGIAAAAGAENESREARARHVAQIIRDRRGYRWVGIYDVGDTDVTLLAYAGTAAPQYPTFPIDKGLTAAAIAQRSTVVSNDVAHDPRYLTAFSSTGSEAIVPILGAESGIVIGTLDVESAQIDAFSHEDQRFLEECATSLVGLYE